jgi:hypothetical protein
VGTPFYNNRRKLDCSKNELKTLSDSVAEIPQLPYDFQSATLIFYHFSKFYRFSAEQITELDTAIKAKTENMEQTLRSYFPNATADPVYKVFTQWAGLGYAAWVFFRSKTHWANQIFIRYRPFETGVDNLLPALNGLFLGSKTKPECQVLGAAPV